MKSENKRQIKTKLHTRNKNREMYDLDTLKNIVPELSEYIKLNKYGNYSVDFSNSKAVRLLNKAILNHYYGIKNWNFPNKNLCPPIPGRADYIHYIADLLSENNLGKIPFGNKINCIDIGVGASCIYPIIGVVEYGWNFIGTDIDQNSIKSAENIVNSNTILQNKIKCKLQANPNHIFQGIIGKKDKIDLTICNPPFHSSLEEAKKASQRKIRNLHGKKSKKTALNFSGIEKELIYEGGEKGFIKKMIIESKEFSKNCCWFSTLVSKSSELKSIYFELKKYKASKIKTINMGTGNKSVRIVAWTFLSEKEQNKWRQTRWNN